MVNIGGNKYRLIAAIHFNRGRIFVRHIAKHGVPASWNATMKDAVINGRKCRRSP